MTRIDTLRRQVEQILQSLPMPTPDTTAEVIWLKDVSDEELDQLHAMALQRREQGGSLDDFDVDEWRASHPLVSREELTASFLSIDIDAVPDEMLPGYPLSRTGYNNMLNYIRREKYDAYGLHAWSQWRARAWAR